MADAHVTLKPQHPSASLDHAVTVQGLAVGETLSGTPTVTPETGLTVGTSPAPVIGGAASNVVTFWLSGGTSGRRYQGEIRCATSGSRTVVITFDILIYDRSPKA